MKFLGKLLRPLWTFLNNARKVIVNVVFFAVLIFVFLIMIRDDDIPEYQSGAFLVVNPSGVLVEELTYIAPADRLMQRSMGTPPVPEVDFHQLISTLDYAIADPDIGGILLDLGYFWGGGLSKLQVLGDRLQSFRDTGRPVFAYGDYYSQSQYFLAAHADAVYLHPHGAVTFDGYHAYQNYFRDLLDKLHITPHIFRVGEYKSAVEPYARNAMSDEAREANQAWINTLWREYLNGVSAQRDITPALLSGRIEDFEAAFAKANDSHAQLAINEGLVDGLMDSDAMRQLLVAHAGEDADANSFQRIGWRDYHYAQRHHDKKRSKELPDAQIRMVIARGTIHDGDRNAGTIGADRLVRQLRAARFDDRVKAVVIRIDSPGGSAFASEKIREELARLRNAGKPVVASLSSVAASGGYWIAAGADEIYASSATLTGSIGVFGLFLNATEGFGKLGIYADGVSSTEMPYIDSNRPIDSTTERLIQRNIERIYRDFIDIVAESRGLSADEVDAIARGRVWMGADALHHGLVDGIGEFEMAIARAAELADVDDYQITRPARETRGLNAVIERLLERTLVSQLSAEGQVSPLRQRLLQQLLQDLQVLEDFSDARGVYSRCLECEPVFH